MLRPMLFALCSLLLLAGCASSSGLRRVADDDPHAVAAMGYARALLKTVEPVPVEWWTMPGEYQAPDGMWCRRGDATGNLAGGRTQFLPGRTRIVVYTGPAGERTLVEVVWPHEAVHAVGRGIIGDGHPERTSTGIKLRGVVPYW